MLLRQREGERGREKGEEGEKEGGKEREASAHERIERVGKERVTSTSVNRAKSGGSIMYRLISVI